MPGEHVDQVYQAALAKIYYVPLSEEQKLTAGKEAIEEDKRLSAKNNSIGSEAFRDIESSGLTEDEKQEVHLKLAQRGMTQELANTQDKATLLRTNTRFTNYMSGYMNHYAQDYFKSVTDVALAECSNVKIPEYFKGKETFGTATQTTMAGATQEDIETLNKCHVQIAQKMREASEKNLSLLSPQARAFLKSAMKPVVDGNLDQSVNYAMANTLLLRGASGILGTDITPHADVETRGLLTWSSQTLLSYANAVNKDPGEKLGKGKPTDELAEQIRSPKEIAQTLEAYSSLAVGGQAFEDYLAKVGPPVQAYRKGEGEQQIAMLESKLDKLNEKGPSLDKLKAYLKNIGKKGNGLELEKAAIIEQIDKVKMEVLNKADTLTFEHLQKQNQDTLKKLEESIEGNRQDANDYEAAKDMVEKIGDGTTVASLRAAGLEDLLTDEQIKFVNFETALGNTGLDSGHGNGDGILLNEEQIERVQEKKEIAQGIMKETKAGALEYNLSKKEAVNIRKNITVREALGKGTSQQTGLGTGLKNDAPKTGKGLHN